MRSLARCSLPPSEKRPRWRCHFHFQQCMTGVDNLGPMPSSTPTGRLSFKFLGVQSLRLRLLGVPILTLSLSCTSCGPSIHTTSETIRLALTELGNPAVPVRTTSTSQRRAPQALADLHHRTAAAHAGCHACRLSICAETPRSACFHPAPRRRSGRRQACGRHRAAAPRCLTNTPPAKSVAAADHDRS